MQAITWDKEELLASVQKKLAVLRANRQADKGLTLDQRLVLVDDRLAFSEALTAADNRRALQLQRENARAPRQIFVQAMNGQDKSMASKLFGGHFFARVDDVGHANGAGHDGDSSAARGSKPAQHTLTDSYAGTQSPQAASKKDSDKTATKQGQGERLDSHATDIKLNPRADKPFVPHAERYKAALKK